MYGRHKRNRKPTGGLFRVFRLFPSNDGLRARVSKTRTGVARAIPPKPGRQVNVMGRPKCTARFENCRLIRERA